MHIVKFLTRAGVSVTNVHIQDACKSCRTTVDCAWCYCVVNFCNVATVSSFLNDFFLVEILNHIVLSAHKTNSLHAKITES